MASNIRNYVDQNRNEEAVRLADDVVDAALQTEIDNIETAVGLNTDGTFTPNASTNYIPAATSIKHSLNLLDAKIKDNTDDISGLGDTNALETEIDNIETSVGLNTDGTFTAPVGTDYLGASSSIKDSTIKLDTQVKLNNTSITNEVTNRTQADANIQTEINDTQTGAGLESNGDYAPTISADYISTATSLKDADNKLDVKLKSVSDDVFGIINNTWLTKTTNYVSLASDKIFADTSSGVFTITLPATPSVGDTVKILDLDGKFGTNNLTIGRNSSKIMSLDEDMTCDINDSVVVLTYTDSTNGWKLE